MGLVDSRTGIEVMERSECLSLLDAEFVGRLAILDGGTPLILPINYALDGEHVVFRTAAGAKISAKNRPACFEIDGHDDEQHLGWSVVIRGRLEEVTTHQAHLFDRLADLPQPWALGDKPHVMRLVPDSIQGRRVTGNEAPPAR